MTKYMQDIVQFLENQKKSNDISIVREALDKLNLYISSEKVIIVAGTNGKGTTCATLQTLLVSAGKNVGFFCSPHLMKINERIKFNKNDISDDNFCKIFQIIHKQVINFSLSCFEYLTLMAAYYFFEEKKVDYAIFEVGLGGTVDATNAIPHKISVITKLGMDHENILGYTIEKIAENKMGIISTGNKVFHAKFPNSSIKKLFQQIAKATKSEVVESYPYNCDIDTRTKYPTFYIRTKFGKHKMSMPGQRAAENTALAITVFDHIVNDAHIYLQSIAQVFWPGRMEKVRYKNHDVFLSGDHNPQGIQSLLDTLRYYNFATVHFIVGICCDKSHEEMLRKLENFNNSVIYITETPIKPLSIIDYKIDKLTKINGANPDPLIMLEKATNDSKDNDVIVVTGSLYLVGFVRHFVVYQSN